MKHFICVFCFWLLTSISAAYAQTGWVQQTVAAPGIDFYSVHFRNASLGLAVGTNGTIMKTTNGGIVWVPKLSLTTNTLYSVKWSNNDNDAIAVGQGGIVLKTTNAVELWTSQTFSNTLYSLYYSGTFGYAVGANGTILATTNGGANWTALTSGTTESLNCISMALDNYGLVAGAVGVIRKTIEGIAWTGLPSGTASDLKGVTFPYFNTGWACGSAGTILKTTDAGLNWARQNVTSGVLNSIHLGAFDKLWTVGNAGKIMNSTNAGTNWIDQTSPVTTNLNCVYMVDATTGYIAGASGIILKTVNGGVGVRTISSEVPGEFKLFSNYPNPFNPITKIKFNVPKSEIISLKIYDINGKLVEELFNNNFSAGSYEAEWNAKNFASGIYFNKVESASFSDTKRMMLVK